MCNSYKYVVPIISNVNRYLSRKTEADKYFINHIRRERAERDWENSFNNIKHFSKEIFNDIQSNKYKLRDVALFASDYYFENNELFNKFYYNDKLSEKIMKKSFEYSNENYIFNITKLKNITAQGGIDYKDYFEINEDGEPILFKLIIKNHLNNILACEFYETLHKSAKSKRISFRYKTFLKIIKINKHILQGE